jgi:hypothetical protein
METTKNGDPLLRTRKIPYYHDTTEFFVLVREVIFDKVAPLYEEGWSLRDIQAHTGLAKTTIRKALLENGVSLRENKTTSHLKSKSSVGKRAALPPYGFCYFQGKVVPHPKEHDVLLQIYRHWKEGDNANVIFKILNGKRIPSRMAKEWSWNAVQNILDRLNKKQIVVIGGRRCEIR